VEVEGHYYSVPYVLVRQLLDVRLSAQVVELFSKGKRVASHQRSPQKGRHSTVTAHMPTAHRHYAEWTPQRLIHWAVGIMRLGKRYGDERLEAACRRALALGAYSYKSIESILKNGLDRSPLPEPPGATGSPRHPNIRGPQYYQEQGEGPC
jgi:transposase